MNKKTILVIDDEEDFCFFLKHNLERSGKYRVLTALSGLDGIRLARQYKPDLTFLILPPDVVDSSFTEVAALTATCVRRPPHGGVD